MLETPAGIIGGSVQLTVMGGIPGREMGVVRGGKVGIPGMLGGVGAGRSVDEPEKIGAAAFDDV